MMLATLLPGENGGLCVWARQAGTKGGANVLHYLPSSRNQPLKTAGDNDTGILKNKIKNYRAS